MSYAVRVCVSFTIIMPENPEERVYSSLSHFEDTIRLCYLSLRMCRYLYIKQTSLLITIHGIQRGSSIHDIQSRRKQLLATIYNTKQEIMMYETIYKDLTGEYSGRLAEAGEELIEESSQQ